MTVRKSAPSTRYRALVGLAFPTSPAALARLAKGEHVPIDERAVREVTAGDVVDDIPATSIPWLLEQGLIEEVPDGEVG